jgi:hypothetical protein
MTEEHTVKKSQSTEDYRPLVQGIREGCFYATPEEQYPNLSMTKVIKDLCHRLNLLEKEVEELSRSNKQSGVV